MANYVLNKNVKKTAMSVGGLQGLIQRKSWQEAAKLMLRYGKLGSVPIVAANLAFMAIQCA